MPAVDGPLPELEGEEQLIDEDDANPMDGADTCLETKRWRDRPDEQRYTRKTWDGETRVLTEEQAATPDFVDAFKLQWRYSQDGRVHAKVGFRNPFQHDYSYDEHDNLVDLRLTYPETPDVHEPSSAEVWLGTRYENEYDLNGRLVASVATPYGDGRSNPQTVRSEFSEDDLGRCATITADSDGKTTVRTFQYDAAGRLVEDLTTTPVEGEPTDACPNRRETWTYNEEGRLLTRVAQCSGGFLDATLTENHRYLPDGSEVVDYDDGFTDVNGERYSTLERSAACLEIDRQIGTPSAACKPR